MHSVRLYFTLVIKVDLFCICLQVYIHIDKKLGVAAVGLQ